MSTILAIGAHIGDMELSAGGVLATESRKGNKIVLCALTAGEKGNPKGLTVEEYKKQKIDEADRGAKLLSADYHVFTENEDGRLLNTEATIWKLVDLIRSVKPNAIITHWKNSVHKDHEMCSRIVSEARYYASNGFERELPPFPVSKLYFAENLEDKREYKPFIYYDISSGYELWKELISIHSFSIQSSDHRYWEYYDALSIIRGEESKTKRAQTFMVRDSFDYVVSSNLY